MIPVTSVEEEDTVNFHSDLQRPFLRKKQEKQKLVGKTSWKVRRHFTFTEKIMRLDAVTIQSIKELERATVSF